MRLFRSHSQVHSTARQSRDLQRLWRLAVPLLAGVLISGCSDEAAPGPTSAPAQASVPGCTDGTPSGQGVETRPGQSRAWIEDAERVVEAADVVFIGTVIAAENPYGEAVCPNGTAPSQHLTVTVDEVLYGDTIDGDVQVVTWDTSFLVAAHDQNPEGEEDQIILAVTRLDGDTWEARGPDHLTAASARASWEQTIASVTDQAN